MSNKICIQCGTLLGENENVCPRCGMVVKSKERRFPPEVNSEETRSSTYQQEQANNQQQHQEEHYEDTRLEVNRYGVHNEAPQNRVLLISISVVAMIALIAIGFFLVKGLRDNQNQKNEFLIEEKVNEDISNKDVNNKEEPKDSSKNTTIDEEKLPASSYVATPGNYYLFTNNYPSGEVGTEEKNTGKLNDNILSTNVTFFPDPEGVEGIVFLGDFMNYVEKDDGVYQVFEEYGYEVLWLPNNYEKGFKWSNDMEEYTIVDTNVTKNFGEFQFENCIIRHYKNDAVGYELTEYIAPGHGVVYSEYSSNSPALVLQEISIIDIE